MVGTSQSISIMYCRLCRAYKAPNTKRSINVFYDQIISFLLKCYLMHFLSTGSRFRT